MIILQSNGWQVEKERRTEIQKIEYLENKKRFLDEIKSIFHSFWRAIISWKNKNLMKIADTSFKCKYSTHIKVATILSKIGINKNLLYSKLLILQFKHQYILSAWKVSKCDVISGPYFPVFGLIRTISCISRSDHLTSQPNKKFRKNDYETDHDTKVRMIVIIKIIAIQRNEMENS